MTAADFRLCRDDEVPEIIYLAWSGRRCAVHIERAEWTDTQYDIQPGEHAVSVVVTERSSSDPAVMRSRSIGMPYRYADRTKSTLTEWEVR